MCNQRPDILQVLGWPLPHATSVDSHDLLHEIQYRLKIPLRLLEEEEALLYLRMSIEFVIKSPPGQADQRGHDTPADGCWKAWAARWLVFPPCLCGVKLKMVGDLAQVATNVPPLLFLSLLPSFCGVCVGMATQRCGGPCQVREVGEVTLQ